MKLEEAKQILNDSGYKLLKESEDSEETSVYLYLDKPSSSKIKNKVWFDGSDISDITLNLDIDYFKELLSKLGVSNKFFKLIDDLDWSCIQETYEYEGDLYAFGEAQSRTWDNGAFGGNNNPDFDWGGEIVAQTFCKNEDGVAYFLRNITAEALVALFNNSTDTLSMYDYIDNKNIEDAFTNDEYGEEYKKYIDEFGVTIDEVVDFVNAMSNDKLIQTLAKDIQETPDFSEDLN